MASWNSLPGDTLYPIKRGLEKIAIALTPQSLLEVKLHFTFLDRRTEEASIALIQKPTDHSILNDIITEAQAAQISTTNLKSEDKKIVASLELINKVHQTTKQLDQVKSDLSSSVKDDSQPYLPTFQKTTDRPLDDQTYTPTITQPEPEVETEKFITDSTLPVDNPPTLNQPSQPAVNTKSVSQTSTTTQTTTTQNITNATNNPTTSIIQVQQQLNQIATSLEQQLKNQNLKQEHQEKLRKLKEENNKRYQPDQPTCQDKCGDNVCAKITCQAIGCPCSESYFSCPEDCLEQPVRNREQLNKIMEKQKPLEETNQPSTNHAYTQTNQCWSRVEKDDNNQLYWPNETRGGWEPKPAGKYPLTSKEIKLYDDWVNDGRPRMRVCALRVVY